MQEEEGTMLSILKMLSLPRALHMQTRTEARKKTDTGISYRDLEKHNLS